MVRGKPGLHGIASERHASASARLLDDARAKGATVTACGDVGDGRQMPLHIVTGCTPDMRVMREEIFGPILPVVPYDTIDEAIAFITQPAAAARDVLLQPRRRRARRVLRRTHSGGVTINDWGWHVINHDAPFGGVGNSGMGTYHGEEGFRELSHAQAACSSAIASSRSGCSTRPTAVACSGSC